MFGKSFVAFAAMASLGLAAAVSSTSDAEARDFGGGFSKGGSISRAGGMGMGRVGMTRPAWGARPVGIARPLVIRRPIHVVHTHGVFHRPHVHFCHRWPGHPRCVVRVLPPPIVAAPIVATAPVMAAPAAAAPVIAAPAPRPVRTCLTKEYTADSMVVFRDLCTNEMASAPVDAARSTGAALPQGSETALASDAGNFAGRTYQDYLASVPQNTGPSQTR